MDFGVDAAHMKHRKYNGIQTVLASRDGNISNKIAAIALVPVEDYDNYSMFFLPCSKSWFPTDYYSRLQ